MDKIKKILLDYRFYFLLCFILFLIIEKNVIPLEGNDDEIFAFQLKEMGIIQWSAAFYLNWSGRVILTLLDAVFLNLPIIFWKISNAAVFAMLALLIVKITKVSWLRFTVVILLFSIPQVTFSSAALWITGSFNYLWPVSFSFVFIYCCKEIINGRLISRFWFYFAVLASFIAGNMEQTAAVSLVLMFISMIIQKNKYQRISNDILILFFVLLANFLFLMLSPGNYVRSFSETIQWNPAFDMLSVLDKLFYGLFAAINFLFYQYRRFWSLMAIVFWMIKISDVKRAIPLFYSLSFLDEFSGFYQKIQLIQQYNPLYHEAFFQWVPFFLAVLVLIIMIQCAIEVFDNITDQIWIFLIFCASLATAMVLGFSPTLIGSGQRIYFYCTILLIYGIIEVLKRQKYEMLWFALFGVGMGTIGLFNISTFLADSTFLYYF